MLGKIGLNAATKTKMRASKLGRASVYNIGKGSKWTGKKLGTIAGDTLKNDINKFVKSTANIASHFVREDKANSLIGYRLKKRGIALAAGVGVLSTAAKETKTYIKEDLRGSQDGYVTPLSPSYTGVGNGYGSYGQQAGATGDLVFALNRNRRG